MTERYETELELTDQDYEGCHVHDLKDEKYWKKRYKRAIYFYEGEKLTYKKYKRLDQVIKVWEHTVADFRGNCFNAIDFYAKYVGDENMALYSIGRSYKMQVHPDGEIFELSWFKFFVNYSMLITPTILGADLSGWKPWTPTHWSAEAWAREMDEMITGCRGYGNMRAMCELLEWSKYFINRWTAKCGHFLGLTISNREFIRMMERSKYVEDSILCNYEFGESPNDRERIISERNNEVLRIIGEQVDSPLAVYVRNRLLNPKQFQEFAIGIGNKPDLYGNTIPLGSHTNMLLGLEDPVAAMIDARGGRKAEALKAVVADAGALQRSMSMLMSNIRYVDTEHECDSRHFRHRYIDSMSTLGKLEGRVIRTKVGDTPEDDEYYVISGKHDIHLVGKTVEMKTPISCTHPRRHSDSGTICAACYGLHMANINRDVHIGKVAALNLSDDLEQILLSAKHALASATAVLEFNDAFDNYFTLNSYHISLNIEIASDCRRERDEGIWDMESSRTYEMEHTFLEFHLDMMVKESDGEGREFDRGISEIVLWNDITDMRTIVTEKHASRIYLNPEFVLDFFLPAMRKFDSGNILRIALIDLIDPPYNMVDTLFDCRFSNEELSAGLMELKSIITNNKRIQAFETYNDCLNTITPMFEAGGIHLPDLQAEMLVSALIWSEEDTKVDWNHPDPEYKFYSIDKSIQYNSSPLVSILHHDPKRQLTGKYNTFEKNGTSVYDMFIFPDD